MHPACRRLLLGWLAVWAGVWMAGPARAQLGQKPSGYRASAQVQSEAADPAPWLDRLADRQAFDRLARVYDRGTPMELPHLLFVIDRARQNRVYFLNTRRYALHEHFLKAHFGWGNLPFERLEDNYRLPNRRFLFGTLGWQPSVKHWAFEFWEGDVLTPELLRLAQQALSARFFATLVFKANASQQEGVAAEAGVVPLTLAEVIQGQGFLPLNPGVARGRLRVLDDVEQADDLEPDDIVVLHQVPLNLAPVAGVVNSQPSTTLSHVNLLAKGWGIPSAYVRNTAALEALAGQWVELKVERTGYHVRSVPAPQAGPLRSGRAATVKAWPQPVLTQQTLLPLAQLRQADRQHCGSKAATLGALGAAVRQGRLQGVAPVPDGFCIPFSQFAAFMASPGARQALLRAEQTPGFATQRKARAAALEALRSALLEVPVPPAQVQTWVAAWQSQLGGDGVFVRSSSNSEDLPHFSGAGLYSTVPNVREAAALELAVKKVWASVFNAEAYEARRWAGVPHDRVVMGVLVQRAVDARASGVLVTVNPFDPLQRGVTYISAKRGLGIRVVEGRSVAEQVVFTHRSGAVQLLSRSDDDVALLLDAQGGVREQALDGSERAVLGDALVRELAHIGTQIKALVGFSEQDVEWAVDAAGRIHVLQARPYVDHAGVAAAIGR